MPLEQVRVGVTLLDENGEPLAEAASLVALDLVDVEEKRAPAAVLFETVPGEFDPNAAY